MKLFFLSEYVDDKFRYAVGGIYDIDPEKADKLIELGYAEIYSGEMTEETRILRYEMSKLEKSYEKKVPPRKSMKMMLVFSTFYSIFWLIFPFLPAFAFGMKGDALIMFNYLGGAAGIIIALFATYMLFANLTMLYLIWDYILTNRKKTRKRLSNTSVFALQPWLYFLIRKHSIID